MRRVYTTRKGYLVISDHALERMDERKIPVSVIIATYENPDMVLPNADHLNARNHVRILNGIRYKIGVRFGEGAPEVITIFNWKGTVSRQ